MYLKREELSCQQRYAELLLVLIPKEIYLLIDIIKTGFILIPQKRL